MGDPTPPNIPGKETGRNLAAEFNTAAQIGRMAIGVARERADGRYTYLQFDTRMFPRADVESLRSHSDAPTTEDDVAKAKAGTLGIAIEIAAQLAEAPATRSQGLREDLKSVEDVVRLASRSHGLVMQEESQNPQMVAQKAREAIARRKHVPVEQITTNDQAMITWVDQNFQAIGNRLPRYLEAVKAVLRR